MVLTKVTLPRALLLPSDPTPTISQSIATALVKLRTPKHHSQTTKSEKPISNRHSKRLDARACSPGVIGGWLEFDLLHCGWWGQLCGRRRATVVLALAEVGCRGAVGELRLELRPVRI